VPLLREAVDGGVLEVGADRRYWFVHPLLAEALADGLLPEERRELHEAFAAAYEAHGGAPLGLDDVIALADHHYRAGRDAAAFRWALRAAAAAEQAGGASEMLRLLRRAWELWPLVPGAEPSRPDLLERIREAALRAGAQEEELAAVEDLLTLTDRQHQPLRAADLLVRRMHLRFTTGRAFWSLSDVREAVRLSADHPDSAEYAQAMAELAHAELWHDEPAGPARAVEALRLARACGSPRALAYALTTAVMARVITGDRGGSDEALQAQTLAAQECMERLRVALGSAPGPMADVGARLTATQLAVRQGRLAEAEAHLARAEEVFVETSEFLAFEFDAVRAEVAVAAGATAASVARYHACWLRDYGSIASAVERVQGDQGGFSERVQIQERVGSWTRAETQATHVTEFAPRPARVGRETAVYHRAIRSRCQGCTVSGRTGRRIRRSASPASRCSGAGEECQAGRVNGPFGVRLSLQDGDLVAD
jgi:hypothetical protein